MTDDVNRIRLDINGFPSEEEYVSASDHDRVVAARDVEINRLTYELDKSRQDHMAKIASQAKEIAELNAILRRLDIMCAADEKAEAQLRAELETARRVRDKLTEQRNDVISDYQHQVLYYDKPKYITECIEVQIEQFDAQIAAIDNAPKILEDTGGEIGRMEILEVHGDEKDGTK